MSRSATTTGTLRSAVRIRRTLSAASLRRRAWEDGILGGDVRWLVLGGLAWAGWAVAWAWRREPEVVYRTKLKAGESVVIATRPPLDGRARPS